MDAQPARLDGFPLVSVIMTTYRRQPEIVLRAIKSIKAQTYPSLEIIVVDDSPKSYELRADVRDAILNMADIRYLAHEENLGACAARNTGLQASNGAYVAFLDDDDEWLPEKIEKQIRLFSEDTVGLVYCGNYIRNDINGSMRREPMKNCSGMIYEKLILENFIGSTSFPLIRKDYLVQIGGFDPLMRSAQDFDVWLRMARKWEVRCVPEPLVVYHVHGEERITTNPLLRISGQKRIIEKNAEFLQQHKNAKLLRQIKLAPEYASNKQLGKAMWIWFTNSIQRPLSIQSNVLILYRVLQNALLAFRKRR